MCIFRSHPCTPLRHYLAVFPSTSDGSKSSPSTASSFASRNPRPRWRCRRKCSASSHRFPRFNSSALLRASKAAYISLCSPANTRQDISTPPSSSLFTGGGDDGSRSEAQTAHRQNTFQCSMLVMRFSLMSCSRPLRAIRIVSTGGFIGKITFLDLGRSIRCVEC